MPDNAPLPNTVESLAQEIAFLSKRVQGVADHVRWRRWHALSTVEAEIVATDLDPEFPFCLHLTALDASARVRFCNSDALGFIHVLQGAVHIDSGVQSLSLERGQTVLLHEHDTVTLNSSLQSGDCLVAWVVFLSALVSNESSRSIDELYLRAFRASSVTDRVASKQAPSARQSADFVSAAYGHLKNDTDLGRLRLKTELHKVLQVIAEEHAIPRLPNIEASEAHAQSLRKLLERIEREVREPLSLNEAAGMLAMSPSYFCKYFKRMTGHTFTQHVLHLRIDRAKQLLAQTDRAINDIGDAVGFRNHGYFDRVFRRLTTLSPSEYRTRKRSASGFPREQHDPNCYVSMSSLDNVGWLGLYLGMLAGSVQRSGGPALFSASNSPEVQLAQVKEFVSNHADAIILNPVDSSVAGQAVIEANRAGIPVVCVDRSTETGELAALVETDNVVSGRKAAALLANLAKGKTIRVLVLQGDLSTSSGLQRSQGFFEGVQHAPNLDIAYSMPCYWNEEFAYDATIQTLTQDAGVDAIFLASDNAYLSPVLAALRDLDRLPARDSEGDVLLVSIDGSPGMLDCIRRGQADGTVAQDLYLLGRIATQRAFQAAAGNRIAEKITRIVPIEVTQANVGDSSLWGNMLASKLSQTSFSRVHFDSLPDTAAESRRAHLSGY